MQDLPGTDLSGVETSPQPLEPERVRAGAEPPLDSDSPVARRWVVATWVAAGLWLLLLAVPVLATSVQVVDDWVWQLAVSAEQGTLVAMATALDVVGGALVMGVGVVGVALLLAWWRRWPALAVWLTVAATSQVLNVLIKELYERPRPPLPLVEVRSWSFVSGHALTTAAFAVALVLILVPASTRRRTLLVAAVAYALVMAASRVYLRAHWSSDALAGVTVGAATALAIVVVASWWEARTASSTGR
ncbi:MAG: phosphatase PAP2 family protein [Chloroflexota bacterium]